ncbi:GNAT family N-acetyltransferase [Nonomuraea sp. NPDC049758]|uniref:GNAT family N-acetyltransferase n=1 Tax=Nonomuraea sp. NPDC049758 TaxID=3154360 RepID=UPI00342DEAB7
MTGIFTVFPASPGDGETLGEIHAESWKAAYAGFFSPDFFDQAVRHRRGKWHDVLAETPAGLVLAALDGRRLAFAHFGPSPSRAGAAELRGFYGHPDGWGTGVAAALMTDTLRRIRDDGFTRVHLWTLRDTPRARRFYAKSGFTESGAARTHDYGDGNPVEQVEYELSFP